MIDRHKKIAMTRLNKITGQLNGLKRMIEQETYCIDIITQILAVQRALSGVQDVILQNHLSTHVAHQMKHGNETKAIQELVRIYKLSKRT